MSKVFFKKIKAFPNTEILRKISTKEELIYKQVKIIRAFEKNIDLLDKALNDAVKENKIILARACESRNTVHED